MLLFHTAGSLPGHPLTLFRDALSRGAESACLLVPTSTLAEHLRHSMAREGAFVRPDSIVTLSRFIEPYIRDIPPPRQPSSTASFMLNYTPTLPPSLLRSPTPKAFSACSSTSSRRSANPPGLRTPVTPPPPAPSTN